MPSFERKVLVLDSRYEPVKIVSLEQGFVLSYTGRAQAVIESTRAIRSVSRAFYVPWIICLRSCAPRVRRMSGPRFSRQNVYLRDSFRCQYCLAAGSADELTLDHLVPSAKGGKTSWDNIVTACRSCNVRKGSRNLEETGFRLLKLPVRPRISPPALFVLRYGLTAENIPDPWRAFVDLEAADKLLTNGTYPATGQMPPTASGG